jgi:hypothetical protein
MAHTNGGKHYYQIWRTEGLPKQCARTFPLTTSISLFHDSLYFLGAIFGEAVCSGRLLGLRVNR